MKIEAKEHLTKEEVDEIVSEIKRKNIKFEKIEEKEIEPNRFSQRIQEDIEFLNSCAYPQDNDVIVVTEISIKNKFSTKFPNIRGTPVEINYIADAFMNSVVDDFKTLKMSADSKLIGKRVLENAQIKYDSEAQFFFENHLHSSNSPNSLKMLFGYDLLVSRNVEKVEETDRYDEKRRKIMKVYTDLLGKRDYLIVGAGIGISKHINFPCKIELVH